MNCVHFEYESSLRGVSPTKLASVLVLGVLLGLSNSALADDSKNAPSKGIVVGIGIASIDHFANFEEALSGETFLGYQFGRITVGLSARYSRFKTREDRNEFSETILIFSEIELTPGIRITLLTSKDKKLALWGGAELGVIRENRRDHFRFEGFEEKIEERKKNSFVYKGSLGLRYWMHPQLAIEVATGIRGVRRTTERDVGRDDILTALSPFKTFNIVGVF